MAQMVVQNLILWSSLESMASLYSLWNQCVIANSDLLKESWVFLVSWVTLIVINLIIF